MKTYALLIAAAATLIVPWQASAAAYPDKPIRVIVGFPPGQATDEITRRLTQHLSVALGQPFVVENRPGGGAGIAAEMVARAAPDGYTLLASSSGPLTINGWIYKNLRYDPQKDFAPIAPMSVASLVLVVRAESPYQTLEDLMADARQRPGILNYGSGGNGVTNHLAMEMLKDAAGVDLTHVPYKGGVAALSDLAGGQIEAMFEVPSVADPLIRQGRLRALAVSGSQRVPTLPQVPTLQEKGYAVDAQPWAGILAPAATPPDVLDTLHSAISKVVASPEWAEDMRIRGSATLQMSRGEFADFIRSDISRWGDAVRKAGVPQN